MNCSYKYCKEELLPVLAIIFLWFRELRMCFEFPCPLLSAVPPLPNLWARAK